MIQDNENNKWTVRPATKDQNMVILVQDGMRVAGPKEYSLSEDNRVALINELIDAESMEVGKELCSITPIELPIGSKVRDQDGDVWTRGADGRWSANSMYSRQRLDLTRWEPFTVIEIGTGPDKPRSSSPAQLFETLTPEDQQAFIEWNRSR